MAKKRGRRRRPIVVLPINQIISLGTLADVTVIKTVPIDNVEGCYMISADLMIGLRGLTVGEGPLRFGCANDDLTVTEIKEAVSAAPAGPDDIIQRERARRPVRDWGMFSGNAADEVVNNGNVKRYTIKLRLGENTAFALWVQNVSGGALATGGQVVFAGKIYARWT